MRDLLQRALVSTHLLASCFLRFFILNNQPQKEYYIAKMTKFINLDLLIVQESKKIKIKGKPTPELKALVFKQSDMRTVSALEKKKSTVPDYYFS